MRLPLFLTRQSIHKRRTTVLTAIGIALLGATAAGLALVTQMAMETDA